MSPWILAAALVLLVALNGCWYLYATRRRRPVWELWRINRQDLTYAELMARYESAAHARIARASHAGDPDWLWIVEEAR